MKNRIKSLLALLVFTAAATDSFGADDKFMMGRLDIPVALSAGKLDGEPAKELYLGLSFVGTSLDQWWGVLMNYHGYMGPLMFADMDQPNELDLGPLVSLPLNRMGDLRLDLSGGWALFHSQSAGLGLKKSGYYGYAKFKKDITKKSCLGAFTQYSAGTTDIQSGPAPEYRSMVETSGLKYGIHFGWRFLI